MKISKLWFDDNKIFIHTDGGQELWQSLLWYQRLRFASDEQRTNYRMSYSGIHWPDVDEDISFESFLYENPEPVGISKVFQQYPELNVSAIARRMGMKQSLLAAYISGTKKPSIERIKEIETTIHTIGKELISFHF
jgi:transcriptional regulator with XRE-family HTH domain